MKELLEKLMMDKMGDSKKMNPKEIQAKLDVLKELFEMAHSKAGEGVADGMQKLTVMAPDKEGLMEGVEKAEEMMKSDYPEKMEDMMEDDDSSMPYDEDDDEDDEDEKY